MSPYRAPRGACSAPGAGRCPDYPRHRNTLFAPDVLGAVGAPLRGLAIVFLVFVLGSVLGWGR